MQAERTSTLLLRCNATSLLDCRQCSLVSVNPHPVQQPDHLRLRNNTDTFWRRCRSSVGNWDMEKCQLSKQVLIRSWNITFLTAHRDQLVNSARHNTVVRSFKRSRDMRDLLTELRFTISLSLVLVTQASPPALVDSGVFEQQSRRGDAAFPAKG
jgi:hypothetical protein